MKKEIKDKKELKEVLLKMNIDLDVIRYLNRYQKAKKKHALLKKEIKRLIGCDDDKLNTLYLFILENNIIMNNEFYIKFIEDNMHYLGAERLTNAELAAFYKFLLFADKSKHTIFYVNAFIKHNASFNANKKRVLNNMRISLSYVLKDDFQDSMVYIRNIDEASKEYKLLKKEYNKYITFSNNSNVVIGQKINGKMVYKYVSRAKYELLKTSIKTDAQLREIKVAMQDKLNYKYLLNFDAAQMKEIRKGMKLCLPTYKYADKKMSAAQMRVVRHCLEDFIDVTLINDKTIPAERMEKMVHILKEERRAIIKEELDKGIRKPETVYSLGLSEVNASKYTKEDLLALTA